MEEYLEEFGKFVDEFAKKTKNCQHLKGALIYRKAMLTDLYKKRFFVNMQGIDSG